MDGDYNTLATGKEKMVMGMHVSILRNTTLGDCSLNGISNNFDEVLLVGEGVPQIFEDNGKLPVVVLVKRRFSFGNYIHCEPLQPVGEHKHFMAGGTFVYSFDSRFRDLNEYPIPLHDRYEPPEK